MEPFDYLSVMTSVVLGLGISHLLADLTRLIVGMITRAPTYHAFVELLSLALLLFQVLRFTLNLE